MSTIKVSTVSNLAGTNSTSADNVISGCAKAWVNFNGTGTVAIRASYNVSSITDNGTGDYSVNYTTAMVDTNYSASVTGMETGSTGTTNWMFGPRRAVNASDTFATTYIRVISNQGSNDAGVMVVAVFR